MNNSCKNYKSCAQFAKLALLLVASLALMSFKTTDEHAAEALARRVMGSKAKAVVFEQIDSPTDCYELAQKGNKVAMGTFHRPDGTQRREYAARHHGAGGRLAEGVAQVRYTYELSDYAKRDWDGLIETLYKIRWQMFFDVVLAAFDAGEPFLNLRGPRVPNGKTQEEAARALKLDAEIWDFECKWAKIK